MHGKGNKVMHNLCSLHASDQVRFCIYFVLNFVDEAAILEQYWNEVVWWHLNGWISLTRITDIPPGEVVKSGSLQ